MYSGYGHFWTYLIQICVSALGHVSSVAQLDSRLKRAIQMELESPFLSNRNQEKVQLNLQYPVARCSDDPNVDAVSRKLVTITPSTFSDLWPKDSLL